MAEVRSGETLAELIETMNTEAPQQAVWFVVVKDAVQAREGQLNFAHTRTRGLAELAALAARASIIPARYMFRSASVSSSRSSISRSFSDCRLHPQVPPIVQPD